MTVADVTAILLAGVLCLILLMASATICMCVLHREFGWNPFTTRRKP